MDAARISELLEPFLMPCPSEPLIVAPGTTSTSEESAVLRPDQLSQISTYLDLLLRWNARVNLTSVRDAESIVTRHFGESLFAARCLFPSGEPNNSALHLIDFGSGAGFPGLPIKLWQPSIHLTLLESNQKKSTFLREVSRSLSLPNVTVSSGRAEQYDGPLADVLTLRAVEQFEKSLPVAIRLLAPRGQLALLIGGSQIQLAKHTASQLDWQGPIAIPNSHSRIVLIGKARTREST